MKRYLNKLRSFTIVKAPGKDHRYQLDIGSNALPNELFIGTIDGSRKGLFIYKSLENQIFALSHDDFSYDFLKEEDAELEEIIGNLTIPTETIPTVPTKQ